jgi:transposase InsO family protein
MVDDFSRMVFVYVMKDKTKESVAEALRTHFLKVHCQPSRLNFFTHRTTIKSDMGSEFINHLVKSLCAEIGCVQEFSCPGGGKWQNGTVECRIKELGLIAISIAEAGNMSDASHVYALWQAADVLNVLPCSSNAGGTDETGLPPQYVYEGL